MASLRELVWQRATSCCEYCLLPQTLTVLPHEIDHIIAQQHHGATELDNLCLACARCNAFKGPNLSGLDPKTGLLVRLFHPRRDVWSEHFRWQGSLLEGLSDIGRVTIDVLAINEPGRVAHRRLLIAAGVFPPTQSK